MSSIFQIYFRYILNIQLLEKIYFIHFDIFLTYIFFPYFSMWESCSILRNPQVSYSFTRKCEYAFKKLSFKAEGCQFYIYLSLMLIIFHIPALKPLLPFVRILTYVTKLYLQRFQMFREYIPA